MVFGKEKNEADKGREEYEGKQEHLKHWSATSNGS
jgi:hypothetical protein